MALIRQELHDTVESLRGETRGRREEGACGCKYDRGSLHVSASSSGFARSEWAGADRHNLRASTQSRQSGNPMAAARS
jgi:hypothetical protein